LGEFSIYDVSKREAPRLIKQFRFYEDESPITNIQASDDGKRVLISSSESDTIFICAQSVEKDFECYGFIKMEGYVLSAMFSAQRADQPKAVAVLSNNLMQSVSIPTEVSDARLDALSADVTQPLFRKIDRGSQHVICHHKYKALMVTGDDKHLKTYDLWPQEQFSKIDWRKAPVVPNEEIYSHPLGLSCVETLPNWLITGGKDGTVMYRDGSQPEAGVEYECQAHSVAAGGVTALASFRGTQALFTAGGDGSIAVWYVDGKSDEVPRQPVQASAGRPGLLDKYQAEDQMPFEEIQLI
jgi:WD40 repeat protein